MLPAHAAGKDYVSASAYWEDTSGQATFEHAQQQPYTPYQGTLSRGYSRSVHWVRLRIDGADSAVVGDKLVLRIRPVFLARITLFDPADTSPNAKRPRVTGDLTSWSEAEWQSSNLGFVIPAQPQDRDIWLKLQTNSTHFMMVQAVSTSEARRMDHLQGLGYNWACPRFCVNGLMAGNCRDLQRKRNDRKQRIDRPPVGGLQKA